MLEARHFSASGSPMKAGFALPSKLFDGQVHEPVLHQAVKTYLANQRQGTAKTKTRSFVSGGNQKPWRQKGTGRARQGTIRAPHFRGGGIVFGPQPRDYRAGISKKVKQLARRSALNARAREGAMLVIERLAFDAPKTQALVALFASLGVADQKVLVLTHGRHPNAYLSGRNLQRVRVQPWAEATPYDLLWSDVVLVEEGALTGDVSADSPATDAAPKAKTASKAKAKAKAKAAAKASPKKAAKKAPKQAAKKAVKKAARKPKGSE